MYSIAWEENNGGLEEYFFYDSSFRMIFGLDFFKDKDASGGVVLELI